MMRRTTQHEVRAHLTQFGTVEEHADQIHIGVLIAFGETVLDRHGAHGVAIQALLDAVLKLVVLVIVLVVGLVLVPV
jgi:hypothetical protein